MIGADVFQEYLTHHMVLPTLPHSPSMKFRDLPPSRSISSTRKPLPLPSPYFSDQPNQLLHYPSPVSHMSFHSSDNVSNSTPTQRPSSLRRTSSYGFETSQAPGSPSGFETDAFACLSQSSHPQSSDPWASVRVTANIKHDPSAPFGIQKSSSAHRATQQNDERNKQISLGQGAPPTPPEEDKEMRMDEDMGEQRMDEAEEKRFDRVMGFDACGDDEMDGQRGRRKA